MRYLDGDDPVISFMCDIRIETPCITYCQYHRHSHRVALVTSRHKYFHGEKCKYFRQCWDEIISWQWCWRNIWFVTLVNIIGGWNIFVNDCKWNSFLLFCLVTPTVSKLSQRWSQCTDLDTNILQSSACKSVLLVTNIWVQINYGFK